MELSKYAFDLTSGFYYIYRILSKLLQWEETTEVTQEVKLNIKR